VSVLFKPDVPRTELGTDLSVLCSRSLVAAVFGYHYWIVVAKMLDAMQ
jgi:hypothetical protein